MAYTLEDLQKFALTGNGVGLARGQGGQLPVTMFGRNADVDIASGYEDLWTQGGTWAAPTVARTHALVSDSAADAAAGTGARTVTVYGLNASYALASEIVTLNGVTPVNTAATYIMIYRLAVATAGSGGVNAGAITATAATDSTVTCAIVASMGESHQAIYQVPAGYTGYLLDFYGSAYSPAGAYTSDVKLLVKPFGAADLTKHLIGLASTTTPAQQVTCAIPIALAAKSIVRLAVTASANDSTLTGGFDLVLVAD